PELAKKWLDVGWKAPKEVADYVEKALTRRGSEAENKNKSGVFSQFYAINPVNNEKIPVWVSDYVLSGYGTGAIMAVPAHDQRDFDFAKKFELPIRRVIAPVSSIENQVSGQNSIQNTKYKIQDTDLAEAYTEKGVIINSKEWDGLKTPQDMSNILEWLEKKGIGEKEVNYHLRDWLISRQRYWGPPIPMIYCLNCASEGKSWSNLASQGEILRESSEMAGWWPVLEADLPVLLPEVEDFKPKGSGKSPLANIETFVNTKCPNCGGPAKRETDVSDTFLDSAWYFLRYTSTDIESSAYDIERVKKWLPVKMYIGGAEHSVLHLLYSRFITMVLADLGYFGFSSKGRPASGWEEPYERFYAHGLLIKDGAKMSKSKGNVIVPDAYIAKFGADTLRMYLMFLGPFSAGGDFRDSGIEGMNRFLRRVWTLLKKSQISTLKSQNYNSKLKTYELDKAMNIAVKKVTEDLENLRYNTAIAHLMEYYNELSDFYTKY
ncbi:MAG: class I tRNA ligase family protein, partial [Candidatus Levyibacteriota bacterium]